MRLYLDTPACKTIKELHSNIDFEIREITLDLVVLRIVSFVVWENGPVMGDFLFAIVIVKLSNGDIDLANVVYVEHV